MVGLACKDLAIKPLGLGKPTRLVVLDRNL